MAINEGTRVGKVALSRLQIIAILGTGIFATSVSGVMAWRMATAAESAKPVTFTSDEIRLMGKADEERKRKAKEARKLKQSELGDGYQVDGEGNLTGPSVNADLPTNKTLDDVGGAEDVEQEISERIKGKKGRALPREEEPEETYDDYEPPPPIHRTQRQEERLPPGELGKSMLSYTTVKAGVKQPEAKEGNESPDTPQMRAMNKMVALAEKSMTAQSGTNPEVHQEVGQREEVSEVMPAEERAQVFTPGGVGDMRIGGDVGAIQIVRQGKFLDCVLVNEVKADLVESPVIGMVSRDFISLDGQYVMVPAGSKIYGTAGKVGNVQQARVYIRFDRVIFPDQRSAYFPVRRLPAVDGVGAVGIDGDVNRHFMLMFGSAIALGMLDGLAAAIQGPGVGASPTAREMMMARTSSNLSQVVAGVIQRYGNVVPTVTVDAGSKMKVFFAEDVRMNPYMLTRELSWVKAKR